MLNKKKQKQDNQKQDIKTIASNTNDITHDITNDDITNDITNDITEEIIQQIHRVVSLPNNTKRINPVSLLYYKLLLTYYSRNADA